MPLRAAGQTRPLYNISSDGTRFARTRILLWQSEGCGAAVARFCAYPGRLLDFFSTSEMREASGYGTLPESLPSFSAFRSLQHGRFQATPGGWGRHEGVEAEVKERSIFTPRDSCCVSAVYP